MPSFIDLHTHATAGHVTSFACTKLHSTCSPNTSDRSLACSHTHDHEDLRDPSRSTWNTCAWNTSGKPRAVAWPDWGEAMAIVLKISTVIIWSWPVKCTTTKDRSRKRAVMAEGWGGKFGWSLLCPCRAEKETRGSCPPTGCLPVDRNKLGPDSWRDEKGVWYRTHTHAHGIKALWTARSTALRARDPRQE